LTATLLRVYFTFHFGRSFILATEYDLAVIGSGPGGYVCAIRAAQLGLKVAVIEKDGTFGGTCLNVGCIPSKAMLHTSDLFEEAGHQFESFGIKVGSPKLDLQRMMAHKAETVDANVTGVAFLFKKNKIDSFRGIGSIAGAGKVKVTRGDGSSEDVAARSIVIATGSDSAPLKGIDIDEKRVVTSTGALALETVPKRLVVVGAGVIGLELGSVWRRLGSAVTVVEFLDRILPGIDGELARQSQRFLTKQGLAFRLSSKVSAVDAKGKSLKVSVEPATSGAGSGEVIDADVVLVAIGRRPFTSGLGLAEAGVVTDEHGRVKVDARYRTNIDGIYAIGDVIAGPMLAHKAEDEGVAVAEILAGQAGHVNYEVIPNVVYTNPEIASVGRSEEELKAAGIAYKTGKFPFLPNGRARAMGRKDGFVKVLADAATDRVLGVHIAGPFAGELIHEAAVLMEFAGSAEDLARTTHAHPTLSESVKEAALGAWFKSIHI
jgi:dihydrolipoamide dehydrogenase